MKELAQFRTLCCSNSSIIPGLIILLLITTNCTQSPEKRPSPLRIDSTMIGTNMIRIQYSSPSVKGRKIFGYGEDFLVPFGEIWRTGANEATAFSTEQDIIIDTFLLPKGKYALFTLPGEDSWEVILNKDWEQWGTYNRQESLDVIRLFVPPIYYDTSYEQMSFSLRDQSLTFSWDGVGWSVPINSTE